MNFALVHLLVRSVRGRIVRALRLLKEPKYLIGVGGFAAWMFFTVGLPVFFDNDGGETHVQFLNADLVYQVMGDALPALQLIVSLLLAALLSLWWLAPWSRMALNLTEAEIHILTPMPVKRRHLIQYATLKSQPGILFGCTMMTIFLGAGGPLARAGWFAAFWAVLTLWDLHSKGRALWLEKQKELPPARAWRNRAALVGAIVVYWAVLAAALGTLVTELMALQLADQASIESFADVREVAIPFFRQVMVDYGPRMQSGVVGWLLLPFRWVTTPLFAFAPGATAALKITGLLMPLLLLVAHNEWVVRSQTKFEEAALAHARRAASKQGPAARYWKTSQRSRRRTPFRLATTGPPEIAILWKNSMIVTRYSYRTLALFGLVLVALSMMIPLIFHAWRGVPFVVLSIGFMIMALSPLTGSQSYRNDLRADLRWLEMVRPWPIEGWKLFAAEAAGPTVFGLMSALFGAAVVLAMNLYLALERSTLGAVNAEDLRFTPDSVAASLGVPASLLLALIILGILPVVLATTCLSTTLQNLLVLLLPGWVQLGSDKPQGAAAFGQNMVMFFGLGLAGLLCLLPAALLVGTIVALQVLLFGLPLSAWEFPVLGVIAATPVFAVVALIVRTGGRVWDKLDASQEILEGSA